MTTIGGTNPGPGRFVQQRAPSRVALTREVSSAIGACQLTHLAREPIDVAKATAQHAAYERMLETLGCTVHRIAATAAMPDSVFIEDVALVFPELAVITRPGAESRRIEIEGVRQALAAYRPIVSIDAPATLDGGDVLVVGQSIFVGVSARTNAAGIAQLRARTAPAGYAVHPVAVQGCLHLKSAVTAASEEHLLMNPRWVPTDAFRGYELIAVDAAEPGGANVVRVGGALLYPAAFPRTRDRLLAHGFDVRTVDVSELAKAEGAGTCCSVIFENLRI